MNRIVKENYPVSKLPEDLRVGLDPTVATVTVDQREAEPALRPTIDEIFSRRRPPFRSKAEIDADWRRQRDETE